MLINIWYLYMERHGCVTEFGSCKIQLCLRNFITKFLFSYINSLAARFKLRKWNPTSSLLSPWYVTHTRQECCHRLPINFSLLGADRQRFFISVPRHTLLKKRLTTTGKHSKNIFRTNIEITKLVYLALMLTFMWIISDMLRSRREMMKFV